MRIVFFLLLFFVADIAHTESGLFELIPDKESFPELSYMAEPQTFAGDDLFTMIDGGAEVYLEYGFIEALSTSYLYDSRIKIELQLYQMADIEAAFGVFSQARTKSDSIQEDEFIYLKNTYYLMFQKGVYFGVISWNKLSEEQSPSYFKMAADIASKIKTQEQYPNLVQNYLNKGYTLNQLKYIEGKLALSSIHFFSHKDLFQLETALFIMDQELGHYFIFHYEDTEKGIQILESLKKEFKDSDKVTEYKEQEEHLEYLDRRKRKIGMTHHKGKIYVGINTSSHFNPEKLCSGE